MRVLRVLFGVYLAMVLAVTLWPSPQDTSAPSWARWVVDHAAARGIPLTIDRLEMGANVAMFLPFGFLLVLLLGLAPREGVIPARARRPDLSPRPPGHALVLTVVAAALFSAAIETVQLVIPGRVTSGLDVVLNVLGAVLGGLLVWALLHLARLTPTARRRAEANRTAAVIAATAASARSGEPARSSELASSADQPSTRPST